MTRTITRSSGNVFRDLGLPAGEATRLLIRADLLIEIERIASSRRLSNAALAKLLRVSRRRVDDLGAGCGSPKPHSGTRGLSHTARAGYAGRCSSASSRLFGS